MIELAEIAEAAVEHFAEKEAYKEIQPVGEKCRSGKKLF